MDVALSKCKLEKASHYEELLDKAEEAMGLYKMRFPVQENDFKSKKVNGDLDTLHGYAL